MDTIFLRDLRVEAVIGVNRWERHVLQTVAIDLEFPADARRAATTDRIAHTLDYQTVARRLTAFIGESDFQLVETLAERLAAIMLNEFGVAWVRLSVHKPGAVKSAADVGVTIERGRRPGRREAVYVSLRGDAESPAALAAALAALEGRFGPVCRSAVYRAAAPAGGERLCLVTGFETIEEPAAVAAALEGLRAEVADENPADVELALLLYGSRMIDGPDMVVPHPGVASEAALLRPLAELAGHRRHPVTGRSFADLWRAEGEGAGLVLVDPWAG